MPNNTELINQTDRLLQFVLTCLNLPMTAPLCRPLWMIVVYLAIGIGALLVIWAVWKMIDYHLKYRAALRAQAERERVAAPEIMRQHTWSEAGDVADNVDVTDPHLAAKIKRELELRKVQNITGKA